MIHAENLIYRYPGGTFALRLDSWSVTKGRQIGLMGPSGSGKTTLLHLVAGILPLDSGQLRVGSCQLETMSDAERRAMRVSSIGQVFQDFELVEYLTVRENILLPYLINGRLRHSAEVDCRLVELVRQTGIEKFLSRRPGKLSHGEKQRVAVVRALINKPQLVLADEPTASLDRENKVQLLELLQASCREMKATLVVVTHDESVVERMDERFDLPLELVTEA